MDEDNILKLKYPTKDDKKLSPGEAGYGGFVQPNSALWYMMRLSIFSLSYLVIASYVL